MSRYEERLAADKAAIRDELVAVGQRVNDAVAKSVAGLLSADHEAGYQIILGDLPINRALRAIDKQCHAFVARHLPSAGHLRFVSSSLKMVVELERVGDYAATIAREAVHLSEPPSEVFAEHLRACTEEACETLGQALAAFAASDAKLARSAKPSPRLSGGAFDQAFRDLISSSGDTRLADLFGLKTVLYKIERVSDQAKNICEETLFELLGEVKPPKRYRVLFLDARDTLVGPLAAAIASKAYPQSGEYSSAGWSAGAELAPELDGLAQQLGIDVSDAAPSALPPLSELSHYQVIVALSLGARRHLPEIPRKAIFLEWDLPRLADVDNGGLTERLRELAQHLSANIQDLVGALHGPSAS